MRFHCALRLAVEVLSRVICQTRCCKTQTKSSGPTQIPQPWNRVLHITIHLPALAHVATKKQLVLIRGGIHTAPGLIMFGILGILPTVDGIHSVIRLHVAFQALHTYTIAIQHMQARQSLIDQSAHFNTNQGETHVI